MSLLDQFRMDGQVAVVTGSGQGIGRGIAWGLADAGCDVVINARRQEDLDVTAAGIEVSERVPHQLPDNPHNARYLATKRDRSGHLLT